MDEKFILNALAISKKNLGLTSASPTVGCVIVKNQEIIATGVTAKGGRPHAEALAIAKCNANQLNGTTLYVTLEPCFHESSDGCCVDLIIKSNIKKVVISATDPDLRTNGKSIKKLREASIEVVCGLFEKEAREINKGFFKAKSSGLPYVTVKIASSLDGKIATKNFDSKWITGEKARLFAHYLRSINDAIMVGANTVKKDNPMLDCRIDGLQDRSSRRFIIANKIDFDDKLKIFQTTNKIPTSILTSKINALQDFTKLTNLGVKIIFCEEKNNQVDLKDALLKMCASGVNSVLIEGGKNLVTQFLQENLVDELIWIQNKKIIGEDGISAIGEMGFALIGDVLQKFTRQELREIDADDFVSIYKFEQPWTNNRG